MTDDRKRGFLRRVAGLVCHNWGLKLLALALAILIYHTLKPNHVQEAQDVHDRSLFHY